MLIDFLEISRQIKLLDCCSTIIISGYNKEITLLNLLKSLVLRFVITIHSYKGKIIYLNTHCLSSRKYKWYMIKQKFYDQYLIIKFFQGIILGLFNRNYIELFLPPVMDLKCSQDSKIDSSPFSAYVCVDRYLSLNNPFVFR